MFIFNSICLFCTLLKPQLAMKLLLYVLLCSLCFACGSDDPQANLLVGKWVRIEQQGLTPATDWLPTDSTYEQTLFFNADGTIKGSDIILDGGWCNTATAYSYHYKGSKLLFNYSEPGCIPLVYHAPSEYKIVSVSAETLIIGVSRPTYNFQFLLKYRRG